MSGKHFKPLMMNTIYERHEGDEVHQCRICLEEDCEEMVSPCLCSGTNAWVHRTCLDKWRISDSGFNSFHECPTCKFKYEFEHQISDDKYACSVVALLLRMLLEILFVSSIGLASVTANTFGVMLYMRQDITCFATFSKTTPMGAFITLVLVGTFTSMYMLFSIGLDADACRTCRGNSTTTTNTNTNYYFFDSSPSSSCSKKSDKKDDKGSDVVMVILFILAAIGVIIIVVFATSYLVDQFRKHYQTVWRTSVTDEYVVKHRPRVDMV